MVASRSPSKRSILSATRCASTWYRPSSSARRTASTRLSLTTGKPAICSSSAASVRAVSETSMFEVVPVVSALRPSVVSRARETGAPPPTCTGRPSIPLILFAIAANSPESSTSVNGWIRGSFRPVTIIWRRFCSRDANHTCSGGYAHHTIAFGHSLHHLERIEVLDAQPLAGGGVGQRAARGAHLDAAGGGREGH